LYFVQLSDLGDMDHRLRDKKVVGNVFVRFRAPLQ
jgi:hypothetical protein